MRASGQTLETNDAAEAGHRSRLATYLASMALAATVA